MPASRDLNALIEGDVTTSAGNRSSREDAVVVNDASQSHSSRVARQKQCQ